MEAKTLRTQGVDPVLRKKVLRVIVTSLLLDLISFTFILPLYPKLLEFYLAHESSSTSVNKSTLLTSTLAALNAYKSSFAHPISSRYDIVLLGGALGSLFSLLQAIASPIIGVLSDRYGRRTALLWSMAGNILSVALWVAATDFRTFLASRVVGGLSEGNVQLAMAMATDVSDEGNRGATMALVGVCFSVAFTFGPALGAWLSTLTSFAANPFASAAAFSLFLIVTETVYLWYALPETLPTARSTPSTSTSTTTSTTTTTTATTAQNAKTETPPPQQNRKGSAQGEQKDLKRTNSHLLLNTTHFLFIFIFSGMEFSLPFLTWDLFAYTSRDNGRLLGFIGLIASLLQGSLVRRIHPLSVVKLGVLSCTIAFFLLSRVSQGAPGLLWAAASLFAVTSATVVTGLNSLSSFEAGRGERGEKLGRHRSWGQAGRALGPLLFCTLYWWAGRETAYRLGSAGMVSVCALVFGGLKMPPGTEVVRKKKVVEEKKEL